MKKLSVYFGSLVLALGCVVTEVPAQEAGLQSYEVELIIFRATRPSGSPETWTHAGVAVENTPARDDEEPVAPSTTAPAVQSESPAPVLESSFPALGATQFRLNAIEDAMRKGRSYQPLAHIGWVQPGYPLGTAPKFSLQSYLPAFLPEGIALSGEASLGRGARLLHLTLDLAYQAPDGQQYVLKETRRMRSTEKHYLDHPYFGVIALITPKN